MKLTIDRKTWLRGEGSDGSYLLRVADGKMCCLGSYALARGATPDQIRGMGDLVDAEIWSPLTRPDIIGGVQNLPRAWELMSINDDPELDDAERERLVARTFADIGVEVEFA